MTRSRTNRRRGKGGGRRVMISGSMNIWEADLEESTNEAYEGGIHWRHTRQGEVREALRGI